ncbi:MAG TPA: glycosyltransferase family 1 protein [Planctomycetota bacterium]|nr:glycosyltransferase family 1 protein [Planctomycetota bacterium]
MNRDLRRSGRAAPSRVPDRSPPRLLLNFTAYDALASGARERALGLAGALLRLGAEVIVAEPRGADLAAQVPVADGAAPPRALRTRLDPGRPLDRFLRSGPVFARILAAERPDAFLTDFHPVPRVPGVRVAVTVHDLRDLAGAAPGRRVRRVYFRAAYGRSLRGAHRVVVPSEFTRDEAVRRLGLDPDRVSVVPNAVPESLRAPPDPAAVARVRRRLELPRRPYLLAIGVLERRKNLQRLLDALAFLHDEGAAVPDLVLAGRGGPEEARLRAASDRLPSGTVHWVGYVRPADLPAVYDGALALVHPATYEGFGMPVVEAMARGVPVLCSGASALPETAGGAALLFDPGDAVAIARAIQAAAGDTGLRSSLAARGRARAAGLTFDAAARSLLDALGLSVPAG